MKTVYFCDLPLGVQNSIRESYEENGRGEPPKIISAAAALAIYLAWEGIYGYTENILGIMETIDSELSETECSSEIKYTGAHHE